MSARRLVLWGALVLALVLLGVGAVRRARTPPLPSLVQLPAFSLVDQQGQLVTRDSLRGQPWLASFVFTRCFGACPRIVQRLQALGPELPVMRRVSITVDPEFDTPEVLRSWAEAQGIRDANWLLLTGPPDQVRDLVLKGFLLGVGPGDDPKEPLVHSTRLALVDGAGSVRGYYDSEDPEAMARLVREAGRVR